MCQIPGLFGRRELAYRIYSRCLAWRISKKKKKQAKTKSTYTNAGNRGLGSQTVERQSVDPSRNKILKPRIPRSISLHLTGLLGRWACTAATRNVCLPWLMRFWFSDWDILETCCSKHRYAICSSELACIDAGLCICGQVFFARMFYSVWTPERLFCALGKLAAEERKIYYARQNHIQVKQTEPGCMPFIRPCMCPDGHSYLFCMKYS